MKYDSDLIDTIYFIKQQDPALAERMWDRLTAVKEEQPSTSINFSKKYNVGYGLEISEEVYNFMKRNHTEVQYNAFNKVSAIKSLREKTGWGLKDAKDAVEFMMETDMLKNY